MVKRALRILLVSAALLFVQTVGAVGTAAAQGKDGPAVNGEANLIINDGLQTYSFHARMDETGTVSGSLELDSRGQDVRLHADLDCMRIVTNDQAFLSGVISQSSNPGFVTVGTHIVFRVLDNGEGSKAAPDLVSDVFVIDPVFNCTTNFGLPLRVSTGGNIQVKP